MEDIDKNGDGLIDLDEYIGEFFRVYYTQLKRARNSPYWLLFEEPTLHVRLLRSIAASSTPSLSMFLSFSAL